MRGHKHPSSNVKNLLLGQQLGQDSARLGPVCIAHVESIADTVAEYGVGSCNSDETGSRYSFADVQAATFNFLSGKPFPQSDVITMGTVLHDWGLPKKQLLMKEVGLPLLSVDLWPVIGQ